MRVLNMFRLISHCCHLLRWFRKYQYLANHVRHMYVTPVRYCSRFVELHTKKGSLYYTDDNTAYATLDLIGKHQIIAHKMEEYVRDDTTHINGIEGFWSYAK